MNLAVVEPVRLRLSLHLPSGRCIFAYSALEYKEGTRVRHGGNVWAEDSPGSWLDFSANLRPEGTPDWAKQTMADAIGDTRYYPDRSMRAARRGLAAYLGVPEERVLPTAGGAAAIDLCLAVEQGTVLTWPVTFGEYAERAAVWKRRTSRWEGSCHSGDTVMLCNPNNPTGRALSRREMLSIGRQVAYQGGSLVVDEAFIEYCDENTLRYDIRQGISVVGSLTKTLCIPGVRLGYVCATPEKIRLLESLTLTWSLNAFASAVAAELPNHVQEIREDAQRNIVRREHLTACLQSLGAHVWPSQSNFLLVEFGRDMTPCVQALKKQKILVRTCASFGLPPCFLRLAVKTEQDHNRLTEALKKEMGKTDAR